MTIVYIILATICFLILFYFLCGIFWKIGLKELENVLTNKFKNKKDDNETQK